MSNLPIKQNCRIIFAMIFTLLLAMTSAMATDLIQIEKNANQHQPLNYELPSEEKPAPLLPELPPIPIPQGADVPLSIQPKVLVKKIVFEGNQIFSEEQLRQEITHAYENRSITAEELQELRNKISLYYYNKGYINSGAIIHDQRIADGIIKINIIEGQLTDIKISGDNDQLWLREGYIRRQISSQQDSVLNIDDLHEKLQLLQQNPLIKTINAELTPGLRLGEAILNLRIREERPYGLDFRFNNHRSPSVGAYRGELSGWHRNVSGWGDHFSVRYGLTEGLKDYTVEYTIPMSWYHHESTLSFYAEQSDSEVVTEPFKRLDIESESEKYGISFNYLWKKTLQKQYSVGIKVEKRQSKTFLLGDPFSYSSGPINGESDISVVRLFQDWLYRTRDKVIAGRSSFNFGIDAWNPTINHDGSADGRFFSWLGQFQWVERLSLWESHLLFRTDAQWSREDLLPLEKISMGGSATVRGYRENQLTGDNGLVMSLEWRIPLFKVPVPFKSEDARLYFASFLDYGRAWNTDSDTLEPKDISSIGLGLRWAPAQWLQTEIYWGKAFRTISEVEDDNLQDKGVHFEVSVQW